MGVAAFAAETLALETRALLTRLDRVQPFAAILPMVAAASISRPAAAAIEHHLLRGRRELRARVLRYLRWLGGPEGRGANPDEAQRRFAFLKLRFNAELTQLDIFADALSLRAEHGNGIRLGGLDAAAEDALELASRFYEAPPVITYLDRGHGAAIRRARTRLPGGKENPVAVIRIPRERMVGSGLASSLVHEVGHQGAALIDLVPSLRQALLERKHRTAGEERLAWDLWERWISEIAADYWALAKLGVAATQGLMGVVSLPRVFVFRIQIDDPHPFPWLRVKLSAAAGEHLFPDPQWRALDRLWESFYPRAGLDAGRLRVMSVLEATLPELVQLLAGHCPRALGGAALWEVFPVAERQPERLRALLGGGRHVVRTLRDVPPTLAFAVLGQAKQDRQITPEQESRAVADLLTCWALKRTLGETPAAALRAPRARAA